MKVAEAARRLEVSPAIVYGMVASGKLKCYRIGNGRGVIRIGEEHLAEYLRQAEPESPEPVPARHFKPRHLSPSGRPRP